MATRRQSQCGQLFAYLLSSFFVRLPLLIALQIGRLSGQQFSFQLLHTSFGYTQSAGPFSNTKCMSLGLAHCLSPHGRFLYQPCIVATSE